MRKLLIAALVATVISHQSLAISGFAQEATESSVTEKIKQRLQETAQEDIDSLKTEIINQNRQPRQKAYIGSIKSVTDDQLELSYKGQTFTVSAAEAMLKNLEVDEFVIALGWVKPDQPTLLAQKITVVDNPQPATPRQFLSGSIEEIDGSKITVADKTLTLTKKTKLSIKDVDSPTVENIELSDHLFAIVTLDKNGDINEVKTAFILPGKNNPAALTPTNVEATQSAEEE